MHKYKPSDGIINSTAKATSNYGDGGFTKEHISNVIAMVFK